MRPSAHPLSPMDTLLVSVQNADALDRYGAFLADTGDAAAAVATLQRAVALSPEQGFEKYM